jgi:hypothetical protein
VAARTNSWNWKRRTEPQADSRRKYRAKGAQAPFFEL